MNIKHAIKALVKETGLKGWKTIDGKKSGSTTGKNLLYKTFIHYDEYKDTAYIVAEDTEKALLSAMMFTSKDDVWKEKDQTIATFINMPLSDLENYLEENNVPLYKDIRYNNRYDRNELFLELIVNSGGLFNFMKLVIEIDNELFYNNEYESYSEDSSVYGDYISDNNIHKRQMIRGKWYNLFPFSSERDLTLSEPKYVPYEEQHTTKICDCNS